MNYFENIFLKRQKKAENVDDYIFYNQEKIFLEATSSNVYFIKENRIITPDLELQILNGISRQVVLNNLSSIIHERCVYISELDSFDGCFMTNAIRGLVPILEIQHENQKVRFELWKMKKLFKKIESTLKEN